MCVLCATFIHISSERRAKYVPTVGKMKFGITGFCCPISLGLILLTLLNVWNSFTIVLEFANNYTHSPRIKEKESKKYGRMLRKWKNMSIRKMFETFCCSETSSSSVEFINFRWCHQMNNSHFIYLLIHIRTNINALVLCIAITSVFLSPSLRCERRTKHHPLNWLGSPRLPAIVHCGGIMLIWFKLNGKFTHFWFGQILILVR